MTAPATYRKEGTFRGIETKGPFLSVLTALTALGIVSIFYAHTLLGKPSSVVTPIITIVITGALSAMAFLGLLTLRLLMTGSPARQVSSWFMYAALALGSISTLAGSARVPMTLPDIAVFTIEIASAFLLTLSNNRVALLKWICRFSVALSLADFALNLLTYLGLAHGAVIGIEFGKGLDYGRHYLGFAGSSFAEGFIAFLAISYVAAGFPDKPWTEKFGRLLIVAMLFGAEVLIHARTDAGLSVVAAALLMFRQSAQLPLVFVVVGISALLLGATFMAPPWDVDNRLRGRLILAGAEKAMHFPLLGQGIRYRDTNVMVASFKGLHTAGITESGALDFSIAYGIPATVCLYLSGLCALSERRTRQTLPAVLLACVLGSLAISGTLQAFIGSATFFLALLICQREEPWIILPSGKAI